MVLDTISVPFPQNLRNSRLSIKFRYFQSKRHYSFRNAYQKKRYLIPFPQNLQNSIYIDIFDRNIHFFLVRIIGYQKMVLNTIFGAILNKLRIIDSDIFENIMVSR